MTIPILIYTDHANLHYYQDPRKISPRVAGYLPEREQYNILLEYKPGATNRADELLHREDHNTGNNPDNDNITVWPDNYFCDQHTCICVHDMDTIHDTLEQQCKRAQYPAQETLK